MSNCPLGHDKDPGQPCGTCADLWQSSNLATLTQRQPCVHEWMTYGIGSTHCSKCGVESLPRQETT